MLLLQQCLHQCHTILLRELERHEDELLADTPVLVARTDLRMTHLHLAVSRLVEHLVLRAVLPVMVALHPCASVSIHLDAATVADPRAIGHLSIFTFCSNCCS